MGDRRNRTLDSAGPYFLSLVEAGQDCVRVLSPDGVLRHMNAHGRALFELDEHHPHLGSFWPSLWPAAFQDVVRNAVERGAAGEPNAFRGFCPTAKGTAKWWHTTVVPIRGADGTVDWLLATSRDITEEIETRSFLSTLIDLLPLSLMVKSAFDGRYVLVNRAAEDMLGVQASEIVGRSAAELFSPAVAAAFDQEDAEVLKTAEVTATFGEAVVMPTGEVRYFDTKKVATPGDAEVRHVIAVGQDVTERHLNSIALEEALARAEAASEAKMAFLANMSHEIRTPLNGVIGLADSLARAKLPDAEHRLALMVQTSAETLQRLLNDVLDVAGLDTGAITIQAMPFNLASVAQAAAAPWRRLARAKGLRLTVQVDESLAVVGDKARVGQILGNLLSNAVKFTPAGKISVAVKIRQAHARIEVADTGVGFPMARAESIFNRFEHADETNTRRFGGAGLGLAFARELAERMGGAIGCESHLDQGSVFWLDLPLALDDTGDNSGVGPAPQTTLRCLLADDHPINLLVIQAMLQPIADIVSVENGALALEAFEREMFDVVLMDMQMPVMDGLTAIKAIRDYEARSGQAPTPIIMVSASALPEHVEAARVAGADGHLAKPIRLEALLSVLQHNLAFG